MKVVRNAAHRRRGLGWWRAAIVADSVWFLVGLVLVRQVDPTLGTLVAVAAGFFTHHLYRRSRFARGARGEQAVLDALKGLSDDYYALVNYTGPDSRHGDIDLLVLGPMGILVIEVKTYSGTILYDQGAWFRIGRDGARRPVKSVSAQARDGVRAVTARLLRGRSENALLREVFVPIGAVVVFAGEGLVNAVNPDLPVLSTPQIVGYLRGLPPRLTPPQITALLKIYA